MSFLEENSIYESTSMSIYLCVSLPLHLLSIFSFSLSYQLMSQFLSLFQFFKTNLDIIRSMKCNIFTYT